MAKENLVKIGARIKKLRKQHQMTLQDLAEYTGLSIGFLSSVERDISSPSLQNLKQITETLGTTVTELIAEEKPEHAILPRENARVVEFPQYNQTITYIDFGITPQIYEIIRIHPGKAPEQMEARHVYDECCTVLSGELTLEMNHTVYCLHAGDSAYIKKNTRHCIANNAEQDCVSYWVYMRQS